MLFNKTVTIYLRTKTFIMMKNWKTTVGGLLAAVGAYLVNSQVGVLNLVGQIAQAVGLFFLGVSAQDHTIK